MTKPSISKGITGFEDQKTAAVSPWALALFEELGRGRPPSRWSYIVQDFTFDVFEVNESLWVLARFPDGGEIILRTAYCPDGNLSIDEITRVNDGVEGSPENGIEIKLRSNAGDFCVRLVFPRPDQALLRCTTVLTPAISLFVPFWPRDLLPLGKEDEFMNSEGVIYTAQKGPRSGLVYFSLSQPLGGSVFYFQNLTSLNDYCKQTETSLAGTVGGEWPELGMALPAATEKPLEAGREVTLSDVYMILSPDIPKDDLEMSKQFLDFMAQVYLELPHAKTEYIHWPDLIKNSLRDLSNSEKCWSVVRTNQYLNAYVGDYDTPPESMVQLTVLLPLLEYSDWSGEEIPITKQILERLPRFFDEEADVLGRWLPSAAHNLDGSEPQKKPEAMDSWYLYHSLLNISRLAIHGDTTARKLFLDSMDYAIKVAHKFDYYWPVFYDLYTLEVLIAETKEGEGGETDVAGLYAHVMLQAWELTKDERYLEEAKKAARTLKGLGFNLFYQANETLFGAGALLRLWKETGDELFLNLSYVSLANIFNNVWLWECNYGYAEHYKTFFALFPLHDAPYTAVYEELEGLAALHDYLAHYDGQAPEWLKILIPEYIRNLLQRASFYYPPNLPEEVIEEKTKTGELDSKLWIPLEDLYDGWEKAGQVGQEVYGVGLPFGLVPRHYWRVPNEGFMIYVDYPIKDFSAEEKGKATLYILGDSRLSCRLRIMPTGRKVLPEFEVQSGQDDNRETVQGRETEEGHIEYELPAGETVTVLWKTENSSSGMKSKNGKKGTKK
jgi:hypothetical protein